MIILIESSIEQVRVEIDVRTRHHVSRMFSYMTIIQSA